MTPSPQRRLATAADAPAARWALAFAHRAEPGLVRLLAVTTLLASLLPAASTLTLGLAVGAAFRALRAPAAPLDPASSSGAAPGEIGPAALWFGASLLLMLLQGTVAALRRYAEQRLGDALNLELSGRILEHAATLDLAFFEDPDAQDVLSRATTDPGGAFLRFFVAATGAAGSAIVCGSLAGVLLWVDWLAAPALLLVAAPFVIHQWRLGKERFVLERARTRRQRWAAYYLGQVTRRELVAQTRLLGLAPLLAARFRERLAAVHAELRGLYARQARSRVLGYAAYVIGLGGAVIWVAMRARAGTLDLAGLATFALAGVRLRGAVSDLALQAGAAREGSLFLTYVTDFLARRPVAVPGSRPAPAGAPRVELDRVRFRYPGSTRDAVDQVSLTIEPGTVVALVGHNGSGKTTLARLLARLYEPTSGTIRVDGVPLAELDLEDWHRRISLVPENPASYEATLLENVAMGDWRRLLADRAAAETLATEAGLDAIAEGLPDGFDTALGRAFGDADLSRGQWQRVAIARALAHDPGLLVLDEPTANLDAEAEARMFEAVGSLARGRTTVLISHRFSTVRLAHRIFVLERGRLVESGSHQELLALQGLYARLYRIHRRDEIEGGPEVASAAPAAR